MKIKCIGRDNFYRVIKTDNLRQFIYLFLKYKIFKIPEGQMIPKLLRIIRFLIFPIDSFFLLFKPSLYPIQNDWSTDCIIFGNEKFSFELIMDAINRIKLENNNG